jgi:hypothetical protein
MLTFCLIVEACGSPNNCSRHRKSLTPSPFLPPLKLPRAWRHRRCVIVETTAGSRRHPPVSSPNPRFIVRLRISAQSMVNASEVDTRAAFSQRRVPLHALDRRYHPALAWRRQLFLPIGRFTKHPSARPNTSKLGANHKWLGASCFLDGDPSHHAEVASLDRGRRRVPHLLPRFGGVLPGRRVTGKLKRQQP